MVEVLVDEEKVLISDEIKSEFRHEVNNFMTLERNMFNLREDAKILIEKFKKKNNLSYRQIERLLYHSNENFYSLVRKLYAAKALYDAGDLNDN
jgi:hypothetical protein